MRYEGTKGGTDGWMDVCTKSLKESREAAYLSQCVIERGVFLGFVDVAAVDEESVGIPLMRLNQDSASVQVNECVVDFKG